jgi:two-component system sensor histidine kinase FlrB
MIKANDRHLLEERSSQEWFEAIPAGIIIIDVGGVIVHFNTIAKEMFNLHTNNESWHDVLKRNIKGTSNNGHYIHCDLDKPILLKTQALPNKKGQLVLLMDASLLKENNESQIKLEKLESIGKLSASLAHQLRTPLSTALLYVDNLTLDNVAKSDLTVYQEKIRSQLKIIQQQIEDVLLVYKGGEKIFEKMNLLQELSSIVNISKELHPGMHIQVNHHLLEKNAYVIGNMQSLRGAFNNIIDNAIHACHLGNRIDINLSWYNDNIRVEFVDDGKGIADENLLKIMDGFFTTKENGTGLGLSIAKSIIEAHQGELTIESKINQYTKISIVLPGLKD